jgi:hypothetical protein
MSLRDVPALVFLIAGGLIVATEWITAGIALVIRVRSKRRASPVLIPFVGA